MTTTTIPTVEMTPALNPLPLPIAPSTLSPTLAGIMRTSQTLSPADRLWLAKLLLDSLVIEEEIPVRTKTNGHVESAPTIAEVVAQIKATPPNPKQIRRASKTVDEVLANWEDTPADEARLTTEDWEQSWWAIRQEMKQRDRKMSVSF